MAQIPGDATRAVEAVWRIESAKVTAILPAGERTGKSASRYVIN